MTQPLEKSVLTASSLGKFINVAWKNPDANFDKELAVLTADEALDLSIQLRNAVWRVKFHG